VPVFSGHEAKEMARMRRGWLYIKS
jgi:hypothetical protein